MEISVMTYGHPLWENTISFAENCSWKAGPYLAKMMRNKEFSETERVFVAGEGDEIIGYCTFANMLSSQAMLRLFAYLKGKRT